MDQNDDPYARSVHCLVIGLLADLTPNKSWCSEDLEILVVSNLPDSQSTQILDPPNGLRGKVLLAAILSHRIEHPTD